MAQIPRYSTQVGNDFITINSAGSKPIQLARSMWDEEIARINSGAQKSINDFTDILNNPNSPYRNSPILTPDIINEQIRQSREKLIDPNNISEGQNVMLTGNLLNRSGLETQVHQERDTEVKRLRAQEKNSGVNKAFRTLGPIALGLGATLLGGAALAPGLTSGLFGGGAAAGAAKAGAGAALGAAPSSAALLAAPVGSSAGFSAGLAGAVGGGSSAFGGLTSALSGLGSKFSGSAILKGAGIGALGGLQSGGDIKSALKGAALGGLTGGVGSSLSGAMGLSGAGAQGFQSALTGASGGLANKDLKGAALGALLGGGGGYLKAGGSIPGLGTLAGSPLTGASGPTQGSGILGSLSRGASGMASLTGGGGGLFGGGLGSLLSAGTNIYGGYQNEKAIKDMERYMIEAQNQARGQFAPYSEAGGQALGSLSQRLAGGFAPTDLANDPGYQFRLAEGEKSLARRMAAQGMGNSGAALKAAQEYGQGLAATSFNDAYNQWLQQNAQLGGLAGQGQSAAGDIANSYQNIGNILGASRLGRAENRNKTLTNILSGFGIGGSLF